MDIKPPAPLLRSVSARIGPDGTLSMANGFECVCYCCNTPCQLIPFYQDFGGGECLFCCHRCYDGMKNMVKELRAADKKQELKDYVLSKAHSDHMERVDEIKKRKLADANGSSIVKIL